MTNRNKYFILILINLSFSILLIYDYFIYFKYIKQCNDIYPNDVHRLSPNDHHNLYQKRHITSNEDQSCIEMFDLAMYAANRTPSSSPTRRPNQEMCTPNIDYVNEANYVR